MIITILDWINRMVKRRTPAPMMPAPTVSTPLPPGTETWVAGKMYKLGTIVLFQPNGKFYKLTQVDATGTSNGTDPTISTWYWTEIAAPAIPAPAPEVPVQPTPVQPPVQEFPGMPLPKRVLATYFTLWDRALRITDVPLTYNQIYLFHAEPTPTGAFRFGYSDSVTPAEILTCQKRGQRVVLTVGGANAGFNFQTRAQSDAFLSSFKAIYESLGALNGIDMNNFENRIGSSPTEMIYIAKSLKALYGPNFSVTCPPAPGAGWAPLDRTLTKAMAEAGVLDYAGPQFYDSPDLTVTSTIVSLIDEWVLNVGDASKVVVGLTSNYSAGPTLQTSQEAWKLIKAKHPTIRGVFAWSAQDDSRGAWKFGETMAPLVKQ